MLNLAGIVSTLIYTVLGIILFIIGYYVLHLLLRKYDMNKALDHHNFAAGIAIAGFFIALAIVVSGAIQ